MSNLHFSNIAHYSSNFAIFVNSFTFNVPKVNPTRNICFIVHFRLFCTTIRLSFRVFSRVLTLTRLHEPVMRHHSHPKKFVDYGGV